MTLRIELYEHGYSTGLQLTAPELAKLRGFVAPKLARAHKDIESKAARFFSEADIDTILGFGFFGAIRAQMGDFVLMPACLPGGVIDRKRRDAYCRIVRPNQAGDVQVAHTDKKLNAERCRGSVRDDETTLKVWIAIETEPGVNGLEVWPYSHRLRVGKHARPLLLDLAPGKIAVFDENLLHRGALNRGVARRVSAEMTLVFKAPQEKLAA